MRNADAKAMKCAHWGNVRIVSVHVRSNGTTGVSCMALREDTPYRCCAKCLQPYTQLSEAEMRDGWPEEVYAGR